MGASKGEGFTGSTKDASISRKGKRGSSRTKTLSEDDFVAFVQYSAFECNKPEAKNLLRGFLRVSVKDLLKKAFNEESLTLDEIRKLICKDYAKTIKWAKEDRLDSEAISEHILFLEGGHDGC